MEESRGRRLTKIDAAGRRPRAGSGGPGRVLPAALRRPRQRGPPRPSTKLMRLLCSKEAQDNRAARERREIPRLGAGTRTAMLDALRSRNRGDGAMAVILDVAGMTIGKHINKDFIWLVKAIAAHDQAHYPERMGVTFIINAPGVFGLVWRTVRPFIDPATRDKIRIDGFDATGGRRCARRWVMRRGAGRGRRRRRWRPRARARRRRGVFVCRGRRPRLGRSSRRRVVEDAERRRRG